MARVTVEDCIERVSNRFDLVLLSADRARAIQKGAKPIIERDRDKPAVIALRELADDKLDPEDMRESMIHSMQRHADVDEPGGDATVVSSLTDVSATAVESEVLSEDQIGEETLLQGFEELSGD